MRFRNVGREVRSRYSATNRISSSTILFGGQPMKSQAIAVAAGMLLCAAPLNGGDQATKELLKLEGKWTLVKGEHDGETLPEQDIKDSLLVIMGNKHKVKVGDALSAGTHRRQH